jgi:hypothetical protein
MATTLTCLVFGPDDCIFYEVDGTEFHSDAIPRGGHVVSGKLRLCVKFENDAELQVRQEFLAAYVDKRSRAGGYTLGDCTKNEKW